MSKTIDERVVEMRFDNDKFEKNVQTSMSTLDKLKQSLNFTGATKGLENIDRAAKKLDLSTVGSSVDAIPVKFNAMQIAGVTALGNLTNTAVNAGKRMVKALTIDPVKTGFQEYETKINAIQTIMSNTASKGTTMADVTKIIDELNTYADKTIYNFAEMTRNIGTFTAAGVGLEESAAAIKGIANLAAASGSSSQQASTAMYQLSQALAAGTVKLMDWNSVVNAGMGGQKFQDALKQTARECGIAVDDMIKKHGSFRESLSEGWITADILNTTLNKFTVDGAKNYAQAMMQSGKYTKEQADALIKEATAMEDAATKVKTFTQLWGTLKESAQSGWGKTWELIIGNFEQAKERMTEVSNLIGGFINKSSDKRNNLLENALGSKWDLLIQKLNAAGIETDTFQNKIIELAGTHKKKFQQMIDEEGSFEKALKRAFKENLFDKSIIGKAIKSFIGDTKGATKSTEKMADQMKQYGKIVDKVINGDFGNGAARVKALTQAGYDYATIQNLVNKKLGSSVQHLSSLTEEQTKNADSLAKMSDAQLKNNGLTEDQIKAIRELQKAADDSDSSINQLIDDIYDDKKSGAELIWESFIDIIKSVLEPMKAVGKAWDEIFPKDPDALYNAIKAVNTLTGAIAKVATNKDNLGKLTRSFKGLFAIIDIITTIAGGGFKIAFKLLAAVLKAFNINILDVTANAGDAVVAFRDWLFEGNLIAKTVNKMISGLPKLTENIKKMVKAFLELPQVQKAIEAVKNGFEDFKEIGKNIIEGLVEGIQNGISSLPDVMIKVGQTIINTIKDILGIHSPSTVMFAIGGFIIAGLIQGLLSNSGALSDTMKSFSDILVETFKNTPESIKEFAKGTWKIISNLISQLGTIDLNTVIAGAMGGGMLVIINKFANALNNVTSPLKSLSSLFGSVSDVIEDNSKKIGKVLKSFSKVLKGFALKQKAQGLKEMAIAIGILVACVVALTFFDTDEVWESVMIVGALATILGILAIAMDKIVSTSSKLNFGAVKFGAMAVFIIGIASAILLLSFALKNIGSIDPTQFQQSMDGFGKIIIGFISIAAVFGIISTFNGRINKAGSTIFEMAAAMLVMSLVVKILGTMNADTFNQGFECVKQFAAIIAALTIITLVAGPNMDKLGRTLIAMSASMIIMSYVIKTLGTMDPETLKQGYEMINNFVGIIMLLVAFTWLAGKNMERLGITLMAMSVSMGIMAFVIKMLGNMDPFKIAKGYAAISGFVGIIALLVLITELGDNAGVKMAGTLLAMSVAIAILAGVAILLSIIDIKGLAKGIIAVGILGGVMTAMIYATRDAQDCMKNLIVMTVAIGVMAVAVAALSFIDPTKLAGATIALGILMGMFALMMYASSSATAAIGTLIVMTVAVGLLAGVLYLLSGLPVENLLASSASLSLLLLSLSVSLVLIGLMGPMATAALPAALGMSLVIGILAVILGLLTNNCKDTEGALTIAKALSLLMLAMSASCLILAAVGAVAPLAIVGVGALIGVIAIIGTFIAAVGALVTKFPQLEQFLDSGIPILNKIASGIGQFAGNIIAGFAEGAISGLPKIGDAILQFMLKMMPVAAIAKTIDSSVFEGIKALAEAILIITGADLLESITSVITIGDSIEKFGEKLVPLGEGIKKFSDAVEGINPENVVAAANAGKALAEMADALPNEGGLLSKITGDNDLAEFAKKLEPFGKALKSYAETVKGIDSKAIEASASAGKAIFDMAKKVPNEGGLVAKVTGENDLAQFGYKLIPFGKALKAYSLSVAGLDTKSIESSVTAGKAIFKMAKAVPNEGGLVAMITGENDIAQFGYKLIPFGSSLKAFSDAVSGLATGNVTAAVESAKKILSFVNGIGTINASSIDSFKTAVTKLGEVNVDNFVKAFTNSETKLVNAGSGLIDSLVKGVKSKKQKLISAVTGIVSEMSEAIRIKTDSLSSTGGAMMEGLLKGVDSKKASSTNVTGKLMSGIVSSVKSKNSTFHTLGVDLMNNLNKGISSKAPDLVKFMKTATTNAVTAVNGYYTKFYTAGGYVVEGFSKGITAKTFAAEAAAKAMANKALQAAKEALDVNSPSKEFYKIGSYSGEGFVNALCDYEAVAYKSATGMAESAKRGLVTAMTKAMDYIDGDMDLQPTIKPVVDLSDVINSSNAINGMFDGTSSNIRSVSSFMNSRGQNGSNGDIISAIDKLRGDLSNLGNTYYTVEGITYDDGSNIANAVAAIVREARIERRM